MNGLAFEKGEFVVLKNRIDQMQELHYVYDQSIAGRI